MRISARFSPILFSALLSALCPLLFLRTHEVSIQDLLIYG